ncbi:probable splicing factor, arginine/serine-rich 6 isoform X2 [Symsagittifera roscoffensis]|uniref:probable splicing factor, arginine/serine-rich 6 isoform X2 n=1 Tax=Symsagittifera roscoffensis TaxID=84072 RepID=UPI00307B1693
MPGRGDEVHKVYIGNLGNNGEENEIRRKFEKCGEIKTVWIARSPPGFAFVEFYEREDADYAVDKLDGATVCGCRVRVELSHGKRRGEDRFGGGGGGRRRDRSRSRSRSRDRGRGGRGRRSKSTSSPRRQRTRSRSNSSRDRFGRRKRKENTRSRSKSTSK